MVTLLSRTNHGRELRQAQEDMKMAMKAVSVQGTAKLEEEVKILHGKLHEERSRHVAELEKLRLELSEDAGVASQAILTSKIQHLEMQMENIQVKVKWRSQGCNIRSQTMI